jgi:hypothetical protein
LLLIKASPALQLVERLVKDKPLFGSDLDVVKFVCKEFWHCVFRKQVVPASAAPVVASSGPLAVPLAIGLDTVSP